MTRMSWEDSPLLTVNPHKLRREAAIFGRFAVVGLIGAIIDFSVLNLLIFGAGWSSPLQMVGANLVSTSLAILSNFFLNRSWTFRSVQGEGHWRQFGQFVAVSGVGLLINAAVFYLANHYVFGPLLHTGLSVQLAKAAAIGVGMVWNFVANRLWTFRPVTSGSAQIKTTVINPSVNPSMNPSMSSGADSAPDSTGTAGIPDKNPRRRLLRRLLPLGIGLALLALLNWGLYGRLVNPTAPADPLAAPTPAPTAGAEGVTAVAVSAQSVGDPRFSAAFADGVAPTGWLTLAGDWQVQDGAFVQTDRAAFDRAVLYADPFANFVLRVRFKLLEGTGAGLLFNAPGTAGKGGSHMVRFNDDGTGLFWGYFGANGDFQGQGYAATGAPGNDWHVLEVYSGESSYAIRLDGALVAQAVPLISTAGHIGLTTSQSSAAFASVDVFDLVGGEAILAGEPQTITGGNLEFNTINGDWVQEGTIIRQQDATATDFSLGTGVSAENYTLSLTVTLPAGEELADAGAGVLFHMPSRNSKEGAQMVRFVNGGEGLTWGAFDGAGRYTGQGYVRLDLPAGEPQQLALRVHGDSFDVLINGKAAVEAVPAAAGGGWIGLVSYRGPVSFADVQLTLGSVVP